MQADLVLDKADLTGIVLHKWVPTYGHTFIPKFCAHQALEFGYGPLYQP